MLAPIYVKPMRSPYGIDTNYSIYNANTTRLSNTTSGSDNNNHVSNHCENIGNSGHRVINLHAVVIHQACGAAAGRQLLFDCFRWITYRVQLGFGFFNRPRITHNNRYGKCSFSVSRRRTQNGVKLVLSNAFCTRSRST